MEGGLSRQDKTTSQMIGEGLSRQDNRTSQMIQIKVALLNGHAELLTLLPSSTVQDVRTKAQRAFGKSHLKLVTAKNRVLLDHHKTLEEAEIEDGECLTALVLSDICSKGI